MPPRRANPRSDWSGDPPVAGDWRVPDPSTSAGQIADLSGRFIGPSESSAGDGLAQGHMPGHGNDRDGRLERRAHRIGDGFDILYIRWNYPWN